VYVSYLNEGEVCIILAKSGPINLERLQFPEKVKFYVYTIFNTYRTLLSFSRILPSSIALSLMDFLQFTIASFMGNISRVVFLSIFSPHCKINEDICYRIKSSELIVICIHTLFIVPYNLALMRNSLLYKRVSIIYRNITPIGTKETYCPGLEKNNKIFSCK